MDTVWQQLAAVDVDLDSVIRPPLNCIRRRGLLAHVAERLRAVTDLRRFGAAPNMAVSVLSPGARFEAYVVVAGLGAGGMGEVYRATDTTLGRDVALKILPVSLTTDPERVARFRREARLLASLNHPNIAQIHGVVEGTNTLALVLEFVDGESLASRIGRGPIAVRDALDIARQIAEALEAAHDAGIVHRDLKPANVMLTRDGRVKVLDFGLAKAVESAAATFGQAESPTLTSPALMTGIGAIVGTAAYMAPEQARGLPADRRADVWAFGCVLFEMLTGERAFGGAHVTDTLAAIVRAEPDWARLSPLPREIQALLRRCLQKSVRDRLQCIGDARIAIDEFVSGTSAAPAMRARSRAPWLVSAGVSGASLAAAILAWQFKPATVAPAPVTRFTITLPAGDHLAGSGKPALALSDDGAQLAYVAAAESATQRIFLRAMNRSDAVPLAGTDGAVVPFFSPDGEWLGFFAEGKLKKISTKGGAPQVLADVANPQGATWTGHTIVFASDLSVLLRVPDEGGAPQAITRFAAGDIAHAFPRFLPDGKSVLYSALPSSTAPEIIVERLDSSVRRRLAQGQDGIMPAYVSSGHVIFAQADNLMAAEFEGNRLTGGDAAVPVVHGVYAAEGMPQFAVSPSGTLAYVPSAARAVFAGSRLVWVNRDGTETPLPAPPRFYNQPRLSPDGRRIAVDILDRAEQMQVWLYDIASDSLSRFTFAGVNRHPVWTRDGTRIAFMSDREGPQQVFWKRADGTGVEERLTENAATQAGNVYDIPFSFSPDPQVLTTAKVGPTTGADVWVVPVGPSSSAAARVGKPERVLHSTAADAAPQLSPDGSWLAYASDESGRREIYVQAYRGPGGKWQITNDGGNEPVWNPNGRELFYRSGDRMMSVEVDTAQGFAAGKPRVLFTGHYRTSSNWWARPNYDVAPDGQRFLMLKSAEEGPPPPTDIAVVLNWSADLRRLATQAR